MLRIITVMRTLIKALTNSMVFEHIYEFALIRESKNTLAKNYIL